MSEDFSSWAMTTMRSVRSVTIVEDYLSYAVHVTLVGRRWRRPRPGEVAIAEATLRQALPAHVALTVEVERG